MKTPLVPRDPLSCSILYIPLPTPQTEQFELLVRVPAAAHLAENPNVSPGPHPSAPFISLCIPPCSPAGALTFLLVTAQCLKTTPPVLFSPALSLPISSGTQLPRLMEPRCLADRRKTSFPPMCTALKMVSRPRREE